MQGLEDLEVDRGCKFSDLFLQEPKSSEPSVRCVHTDAELLQFRHEASSTSGVSVAFSAAFPS